MSILTPKTKYIQSEKNPFKKAFYIVESSFEMLYKTPLRPVILMTFVFLVISALIAFAKVVLKM